MKQPSFYNNSKFDLVDMNFSQQGDSTARIALRAIRGNDQLISAFPYLQTDYVLPFETEKIVEWSHVAKQEAEICGAGRETFALVFFATDYVENRTIYRTTKKININLSAIGLVIKEPDTNHNAGLNYERDFSAYMPSRDIPRPSYYDFIGKLNYFEECKISEHVKGYMLNVQLINQPEQPDFLTVDIFINIENVRIPELKAGMQVTGALWLQGQIAT
jgi:hypothetical protein